MAEQRRRVRTGALVLASVLLVGYGAITFQGENTGAADLPRSISDDDPASLQITAVSGIEVKPGEAILLRVQGIAPTPAPPLEATIGGQPAAILSRRDDIVVVQVGPDAPNGKAGLRVAQGDRRSKSRDLLIKTPRPGKWVRSLLGGLAFLGLGIGALSSGLRRLAGRRLRRLIGRGRDRAARIRATGVGVAVGAITQLQTSAAGLTIGLLRSRFVGGEMAVLILIGAQLGAAATGILLPQTLAREGLLVIVLGATWLLLAVDRRTEGVGRAVLGFGLLLYGLHLVRQGIEPLVGDPSVLAYVRLLETSGPLGLLACAGVGVVLGALLQGPAPVIGLVGVLVGASSELGLAHALAVLAGTTLGTSLPVLVVAWPSGPEARRLGVATVVLGAAGSAVALAGVRAWAWLADALVPGDPNEIAHGATVLLPRFHGHLRVGFVLAEVAATIAMVALAPFATRWAARRLATDAAARPRDRRVFEQSIVRALGHDGRALEAVLGLALRGERSVGATAEHALEDARQEVEDVFAALASRDARDRELDAVGHTVVRVLELQRSLDALLVAGERLVEADIVLDADDEAGLRAMHELVSGGLAGLADVLARGAPPALAGARAREIELNAARAAGGRGALRPRAGEVSQTLKLRLTEVLDAYEQVGNQLYRVVETLQPEGDALP